MTQSRLLWISAARLLLPSLVLAFAGGGVGGGCAAITRGNKQVVKLITDPPAADVVVDGAKYVSPADVVLKRKPAHEVTVWNTVPALLEMLLWR